MKKLWMTMLALCAVAWTAYGDGETYYLKPGASDLSVAASYTKGSAGGSQATSAPGSTDEVVLPVGTIAVNGSSASFSTLSGVKRVRPQEGSVLEITVDGNDVDRTFAAPVNWDGDEKAYSVSTNYGTIVKKGLGTLILGSAGNTVYNNTYQDYTTGIELREGTLKLPQYSTKHMYFGDIAMSNGTKLVTCGNMASPNSGIFTYMRSLNGDGIITNETGRREGQIVSPYARDVPIANEFHGKIYHSAKIWLSGHLTHFGNTTGIQEPIVVENNYGHLNDGKGYGCYSFENVGLLGPNTYVQLYGQGGGIHYFGSTDATVSKEIKLYSYNHPAFIDAGWHGGLTFSGAFAMYCDVAASAVQKWLVLTGSNNVPCRITGSFGSDTTFSGANTTDSPRTIFTQKLGSGAWEFIGPRQHAGGFAIEEGTLRFDSIDDKGLRCALGLSTNLTTACSVRDPVHVDYAFSLGSTKASAPEATFEYIGSCTAKSTTRPLVLVGKGGTLSASKGSLVFGGVSARDANARPTLTLAGTGLVVNVAKDISDGATGAKVSVAKEGRGSWVLAGNQTFTGDITVKEGNLTIRAPISARYADYKWFRLSIAQIGGGSKNDLRIRQISLFDKDGVRQNEGLTLAGAAETTGGVVLEATDIGPGQAYYDKSAAGKKVERIDIGTLHGSLASAFDGIYEGNEGGGFMIRWKTGSSACNPSPSIRSTWIPITMHLADSANPITHFDVQGYANTADYLPTRICLEASHNGFPGEWEEVYSNVDESTPLLAQSNKGYNQWISDGVEGKKAVSRPLGDGLALLKSGNVERNYFSWFRLSIAKLGDNNTNSNNGDDNIWNVRQIGLYDKYGNRLNSGLTMAEGPTTVNNETRTILGTVLQPGQVGYDASAAGNRIKANYAGELNFCFDDLYDGGTGGRNTFTWLAGSGNALVPWEHTRTTWIPIVMHLASAVELDHFDIETMNNNNYQTPKRLMLEGSVNGVDWYVLYDNATTGEANSITPTSYNWWLSDGEEASNASHARPEGTGFSVAMSYVPDENVTQFPDGMSVQVLPGATLTAENATQTIKSLKVDSAGAGTVDGFTFVESGTIDVTFANGSPQTAVLPGTYVNCEGLANVAGWSIKVNGSLSGKYRVSVKDGSITFVARGLIVSFR